MTPLRRFGRVARFAAYGLGALVLGMFLLVQVQQHLLRWRAERLLADIRAIQMGKSTWTDAQRLMTRWGAWGMWDGSCDADSCEYQIALSDVSHATTSRFWTGTRLITRLTGHAYKKWERWAYSLLGGRITQIYGEFRVNNGVVWNRSFIVFTARNMSADDFLIADTAGKTRFEPDLDWDSLRLHPEYTISAAGPCAGCHDGACTICEVIRTRYTPFADEGIINQLSEVNLSCITKWFRCSEPREIMPAAWRLYQQDDSPRVGISADWPNCKIPIEMLAQDYRYALLTEVEAVKAIPEPDGYIRYEARLQPIANLKGDAMNELGALTTYLQRVRSGWSDTVLPGGVLASKVKQKDRIIFLFEELSSADSISIGESGCSYIPDTAQNRIAVQKGIARDHS